MYKGLLLFLCLMPVAAFAEGEGFKIAEVFTGAPAAPNAQYIMLRATSDGQAELTGKSVSLHNYYGVTTYTFTAALANGNSQGRVLLATPEAEEFFGLTADLVIEPSMDRYYGAVCFEGLDCASWAFYEEVADGSLTTYENFGEPRPQALKRVTSNAGDSILLEEEDDTNDCSIDFVAGVPVPVNNAGLTGRHPASTCGDGIVEGLEGCDDGNDLEGDGCAPSCDVEVYFWQCGTCSVSPAGGSGSVWALLCFLGLVGFWRLRRPLAKVG